MRNRGVDVDVKANIINTRDWTWNVRANFNYNKNEITDLYDGLDELPFLNANVIYKVGHDAGSFYCVKYAGVDPRDGQQMWYTKDGNLTKVFNEARDSQILTSRSIHPGRAVSEPTCAGRVFHSAWTSPGQPRST